jgi:hypothetical protein
VSDLVSRRSKAYERVGVFRAVVLGQRHLHAAVRRILDDDRAESRQQLVEVFGKELAKRAGAARNDLLDAIELAAGPSAWAALRDEQGLSVARARRVVESSVLALLTSKRF